MKNNSDINKKLENLALNYLSKFETSEKQFKDFLKKKVLKLNIELENSKQDNLIENILTKMKELNYVNDYRYSDLKSEKIFNIGGSKRMIIAKLKENGISKKIIDISLEKLLKNNKDELVSALIYLKKRRIGIFFYKQLSENERTEFKKKWHGTLARRGFSYEITKQALSIEDQFQAENIINRMKI